MSKRRSMFLLVLIVSLVFTTACNSNAKQEAAASGTEKPGEAETTVINMAWGFDLHAGIMLTAASKGEGFKDTGIWLKPIVEKEQYELYKDGKKLAVINTILTKGSSESAVMLGQKQLDCAVNSVTGMMSAKDQGTDIQVLCPIHVDGICLVFPSGSEIKGWNQVAEYIKKSENPVKIGYHSPTSAPRVVIETSLRQANLKVTEDPNDNSADVLLVDLKGSKNLLSAFTGNLVDAWVAPSHYPEAAEAEGIGSIALKLNEFPPEGQWYDFPCCVLAARGEVISKHPEVFDALVDLFTNTAKWMGENKEETSALLSEIIGVSEDAVKSASIVFTTQVSDKWLEGVDLYYDLLKQLDKLDGDLKERDFVEVKKEFYNFTFLNN
ncbi:ABC transporter substrate-binding protein [Lutispora saccharofermentans]|uniref:ABC transporter substrate-binding protein n=1 Tax=Lutispora saccharofermentans TaxID=3024236 RepID=A0ABT1NJS6_9FIRM|nr:ABC transporter substrate-binding protein [Lutispora saccharofermentans]MCQ1531522.1 ABC transporter substrate-binding protein [Lutispora saccharofermentans]